MKLFRTPLINWSVSLLLMLGFTAHLVLPTSGKAQKTAFTQWLDRNLVESGEESEQNLRAHLRQLPGQHQEFAGFVKQATKLVLNHKQDFRLPERDHDETSESNSFWLYDTWAEHRDLGGSMDGLLPETVKPVVKWLVQHQPLSPALSSRHQMHFATALSQWMPGVSIPGNHLIPLLSGISINAP